VRWRQVVVLWVVAVALGAEYLLVERPRAAAPTAAATARTRVFGSAAQGVAEVHIRRGGRDVVLRRSGGEWAVASPTDASVPGDLVKAFVVALLEAEEIEHVPPGGQDAAAFGLDERASRIEVVNDGAPPVVLLLGGTNPTGTAVYARRDGTPDVILVGRTIQYYEDLILQALPAPSVPAASDAIGG
jgi:uncharacterized protein DUF4340